MAILGPWRKGLVGITAGAFNKGLGTLVSNSGLFLFYVGKSPDRYLERLQDAPKNSLAVRYRLIPPERQIPVSDRSPRLMIPVTSPALSSAFQFSSQTRSSRPEHPYHLSNIR